MKYELLPENVVSIFGYPDLLEKSVVDEAVAELVADRRKLLADKRALMLEVKHLKERQPIPSGPPEEDGSTYQEKSEHPSDGEGLSGHEYSPSRNVKDWTRTSDGTCDS